MNIDLSTSNRIAANAANVMSTPNGSGAQGEGVAATSTPTAKPVEKTDWSLMTQHLQDVIQHLNEEMSKSNSSLQFSMDSSIKFPVVKVTNMQTGEVIRQIPTEAMINIAHSVDDFKGILMNQKI